MEDDDDGQYWKTSKAIYYGSAAGAYSSARGTNARDAADAVHHAIKSGALSPSDAATYYDHLVSGGRMGMPGSSQPRHMMGSPLSAQDLRLQQRIALAQAQMQYQQMLGVSQTPTRSIPIGGPSRPHEPTSLRSEGVRAGEIIAWRAWNIADGLLVSVTASCKWKPDETLTGDAAGGYGIHAYKAPHGPLLDSYVEKDSQTKWVIGEVALWGDIIEHEEGYRAQYGRVHSLVTWHSGVSPELRYMLTDKYITKSAAFKLDDAA